jgi:peptidoglycan/LPS O-acetylase OafA/YrhL
MNAKLEITDLTACRAAFAAWVFTYHVDLYLNFSAWLGPFAGLVRRGYLGVDGFFMLSGMILARVHPELATSTAGTFSFLGKRLARIYPLHLATILILAALFLAGVEGGVTPRDPSRFAWPSLLQNLTLIQGWGFANQGAWNYPSWSVSTEWAGYLLFPVLSLLLSYFEEIVSIQVVVIAFTVLGLIMTRHGYNLNLSFAEGLFRFFPEFILGMATSRVVPGVADAIPCRGLALLGATLIFIFLWGGLDVFTVIGIWMILFAFTMQSDAQRPPVLGRAPVLRWLGLLSYAFYMSFAIAELLVTQWFRYESWLPASHPGIFAASMLAITFALAVFLHITIELPCRRAADRWLDRPALL